MPFYRKKNIQLSSEMTNLKKEIDTLNLNNTSTMKQIHQSSGILSTITGGFASSLHLLGNIFSANKNIPVIGFFMQMLSMIPKSIETISDPKKSIAEKVFSTVFLMTIVALSIAAFVVGSLFAAVVGTVLSSIITAMEGLGFIGKVIEKYQLSTAYQKKLAFNKLIDQKITPENNQFDELFETRAVELQEVLKKKNLSTEDKESIKEELNFIEEVLQKRNIVIGQNEENPAFKLQKLYQEREEQLEKLVQKIALTQSTTISADVLEGIESIQSEILRIDEQINTITAPVEQLNAKNMIATEKVFLSLSSFSTAAAGTVLSVIGLTLFVGSIAMPPALIGALFGIGIGLASISLAKYIGEKIAEHQDAEQEEQKETMQKDAILEEALYEYEYQLQSKMAPSLSSSHSKYMQDLLTKKPVNEPSPEQTKTAHVELSPVNHVHPVFSKPLVSTTEHEKEQEATTTHIATPH